MCVTRRVLCVREKEDSHAAVNVFHCFSIDIHTIDSTAAVIKSHRTRKK